MRRPKLFQLIIKVELLRDLHEQAVVPLFGVQILPNRGQIEHDHPRPFFA